MTHEQFRECQLVIMDTFRVITIGYGVTDNTKRRCGKWAKTWRAQTSYLEKRMKSEIQSWVDVISLDQKIMVQIALRSSDWLERNAC